MKLRYVAPLAIAASAAALFDTWDPTRCKCDTTTDYVARVPGRWPPASDAFLYASDATLTRDSG